jgi:hypothetical protein
MPIEVSEVSTLQQYLEGIMNRAAHHGPDVGAIALTLAGAVIWRKDPAPIEVHAGRTMAQGTVLWVRIAGQRYAFKYNHRTHQIDMLRNTVRGRVLHSFDNTTSVTDVESIFRSL